MRNEGYNFDRQLKNIDFIKVILMLLVVVGHATYLWTPDGWFNQPPKQDSQGLSWIAEWLGSFHIYAFALVSGYLFAYVKYEKNGYSKFIPFLKNKFKRLLLPYIIGCLAWVIPWYIYFYEESSMSNILRKFVLGQSPQQLWFLPMLFNVFLIAFVFSNIKSGKIGLGIAFALYGLGIVGSRFCGNYFQIWTACQYYLLFYIGVLIRKKRQKLFLKIPSLVLLTFEIVLFALYEFIRVKSGVAFKMTTSLLLVCLHVYGAMCAFVDRKSVV